MKKFFFKDNECLYKVFLIKYSEIGLKKNNRSLFENALIKNIKKNIDELKIPYLIFNVKGRIYLEFNKYVYSFQVIDAINKIFGIVSICPSVKLKKGKIEYLKDEIQKYILNNFNDKNFTFKVKVKRADKDYELNSNKIECEIGELILKLMKNSSVDVHNPDMLLNIEIRDNIYFYIESYKGPGGIPLGIGGKALLLLSGGIDSPVAGYMISKRGIEIEAIYFHAEPYVSERAKKKVISLAKIISKYSGKIKLHIFNFTKIQKLIYERCSHDKLVIIMKRYMLRIAEYFAKKNKCLGIITGESIGQVASQTLKSIYVINEACNSPIYRPLIGMDKQEIINKAVEINTFDTSILPYDDCCTLFVPKHPVINPNINIIKYNEKKLEDTIDDLIKDSINNVEIIFCE